MLGLREQSASMETASFLVMHLNDHNYLKWSVKVEAYLRHEELWEITGALGDNYWLQRMQAYTWQEQAGTGLAASTAELHTATMCFTMCL